MRLISFTCVCGCGRTYSGFAFSRDKLGDEAKRDGWRLLMRSVAGGVVFEWHCPPSAQQPNAQHSAI